MHFVLENATREEKNGRISVRGNFYYVSKGKIEMKFSRKRQEEVGYKIFAVEIQKQVEGSHTSQTLPKLCKDPMIPFVVLGWFLHGLWLVFHVCGVLVFSMGLHNFWLFFIVLHSSRMVFHGC